MRGSRGGGAGVQPYPPPLKNHKAIGFLSNTGPVPLENRKATKPAFNYDGPLLVVYGSSLPSSTTQ